MKQTASTSFKEAIKERDNLNDEEFDVIINEAHPLFTAMALSDSSREEVFEAFKEVFELEEEKHFNQFLIILTEKTMNRIRKALSLGLVFGTEGTHE